MSEMGIGQIGMNGAAGVAAQGLSVRTGAGGAGNAGDAGFAGRLDGAMRRASAGAGGETSAYDETYQKIHAMAEELVSGALVRPVFAEMRETNQAAPPFAPGLWEKTFGPMLDAKFSEQIVKSSRFPIVDTMTKQLMEKVRVSGGAGAPRTGEWTTGGAGQEVTHG